MKKALFLCSVLLIIFSCKKESDLGSGKVQLGNEVSELKTESDQAAYAFGLSMARNIEGAKERSPYFKKDTLVLNQLIAGMQSYFDSRKKTKNSFVFGEQLASNVDIFIKEQEIQNDFNTDILIQAIVSKLNKDSLLIKEDSVNTIIQNYQKSLTEVKKEKNLKKGADFLAEQEKKSGVKKTESGLLYEVIKEGGNTEKAKDSDIIKAHYEGKLIDGTVFDSTEKNNNTPIEYPVGNFVKGFTEGVKLMSPGDKYKLYIPAELAYGEAGFPRGQIGPNEVLVFDVELLEINPKKEEPVDAAPAPEN